MAAMSGTDECNRVTALFVSGRDCRIEQNGTLTVHDVYRPECFAPTKPGGLKGQKRTVLRPLEFAALLPGVVVLPVSETCPADITDIRYETGYELLHLGGMATFA